MTEIPEDIMKAAEETLDLVLCEDTESCGGTEGLRADAIGKIARAILAERHRCVEVARTWERTAKNVRQIEGEGVARDIRLCIAAGIPTAPEGGEA